MSEAEGLREYYAQRANEYDRIYQKPERQADLRQLETWLPAQLAGRHVLEIAGGTGYWSQFIAPACASLTLTDGTLEPLEIARNRVFGRVVFLQADAYALSPDLDSFDAAFAGFWISHVPIERRRDFMVSLHARLRPDAVVVFMDNRYVPGSSTPIAETDAAGNTWQIRVLEDGSHHRILKNFPDEAQMQAMIADFGEEGVWRETEYFWTFQYRNPCL